MLSHGAIIARELGIPAVVNTRDGTKRIPDGARITVDGASGAVTILEGEPA
jgi:phosphohistidine swiveling domain-containing protein